MSASRTCRSSWAVFGRCFLWHVGAVYLWVWTITQIGTPGVFAATVGRTFVLHHWGRCGMYVDPVDEQPLRAVSTGYQSTMTMSAIPAVYGFWVAPKCGMSPNRATTGWFGSAALNAR